MAGQYTIWTLLLLISSFIALLLGNSGFSLPWIGDGEALFYLRLPRVLTAIFAGALMSQAGVLSQGLMRNPLAAPTTLGVTSGSGLAVAAAIFFGAEAYGVISAASVCGALLSLGLMLLCVRRGLGLAQVLLLGVALSAVLGAFSGLLSKGMLHDVSRTSRLFYWGMGDLASVSMGACLFLLVCLLLHLVLAGALFRRLDLLGVGMRYAQSHGVSLGILQTHVLLLVALSVGSVVAIAGSISFVGLMVPHIARVFFGNLSKHLFWGSSLIGGLLLLLVDLACRTALPGEELPLGVLTAILGGAFFFVILLRSKSWGSSHV